MELSDLRVFETVAESGGMAAAAKRLHRVPSNVTARIQKLESELQTQLFIRDRKRIRLSAEGERLLEYSKRILSLADEAFDQLTQQTPRGALKVGSMEAVAATRLPDILHKYHARYPDVDLELQTSPTGTLIEKVLLGELDLALVADPKADARLEILPVFQERLVIVSGADHPEIASADDLKDNASLLGFNAKCAYRQRLTDWSEGASKQFSIVEISSYHALLNCVAGGMGVGIVPEILLKHYPFRSSLKTHELPEDLAASTTCMIWRKDLARPSLNAFVQEFEVASI